RVQNVQLNNILSNVASRDPLWHEAPDSCPSCYPLMLALAFICRKTVVVTQVGSGDFVACWEVLRKKKVENLRFKSLFREVQVTTLLVKKSICCYQSSELAFSCAEQLTLRN
uniref:Uncharacterized protein n=1 Tax=Chelydra serpentina TaxID=8475 RepID=A0A8C3TLA3_CHESE